MELDDLRRQWRQPEPVVPPPLTSRELEALLKGRTLGLVEKMRRNARLEMGVNYALLLISLAVASLASALWLRLFGGLLTLVAVVCIYYFYRKLGVLRHINDPAGDLRGHLVRLTTGLRALIRFYYRFTLMMVPVALLASVAFVLLVPAGHVARHLSGPKLAWVVGVEAVLGVGLYWAAGRATAWYLQRLYGQHLDRLEGQLRELDEGEPHPA